MRTAVFSTKQYDREFLENANLEFGHELVFYEPKLTIDTVGMAKDFAAVCAFVNDEFNAEVLDTLHENGTQLVVLRCAGFNNIDLKCAEKLGITIMRVPAYSPYAVAEHAVGLMLTLNRGIHRAYNRVLEGNFSLSGLAGFDMHGKTVGIIGTGRIGSVLAKIMKGFGCEVLAYDPSPDENCIKNEVKYVELDELFKYADIISLHCPLNHETFHLINNENINRMKDGVMLINTSRGGVVDTKAVIEALKTDKIGYLGLDVYEQEGDLFFEDLSGHELKDEVFKRLITFPNVLVTGHQGYFTRDALTNIAKTTLNNITCFENKMTCGHQLNSEYVVSGE